MAGVRGVKLSYYANSRNSFFQYNGILPRSGSLILFVPAPAAGHYQPEQHVEGYQAQHCELQHFPASSSSIILWARCSMPVSS